MAFCCFPKLKCLQSKNKIQTRSESFESSKLKFRSSSSLGNLNSAGQSCKLDSRILDKSLPEISKPLQQSRSYSHKSMIAVKRIDKFEPLEYNLKEKAKINQIYSLSISRISNVSFVDNSGMDILNEFNMLERAIFQDNGRVQKIHKSKKLFKEFVMKKRETPPMFLKNPCFSATAAKAVND